MITVLQCWYEQGSDTVRVGGGPSGDRADDRLLYDRVERDDLLGPFSPGGVSAEHRAHVTAWSCEDFGGPAGYTDRLGGYPTMLAHHRDLGITAEQRFRFASLMSLAADDADLPSDPQLAVGVPTRTEP
jgi:hemoglobin